MTTARLAELLHATLDGPEDVVITGIAGLVDAQSGDVSFLRSSKFADQCAISQASAFIVSDGALNGHACAKPVLIVPDADLAVIQVLTAHESRAVASGIAPDACVHPSATVDSSASIGARCVIGADVYIGAHTMLHPGVVVESGCTIGDHCDIQAHVVVGSDGFGYHFDKARGALVKVPHIGNVVIGSYVDIGAGTCIDRAKFGSTIIGDGTKIDNLVQIAHNVVIGKGCIICGQTGIAGSVRIGSNVTIGGGASIKDNVTIGDGVSISGRAGVITDIPAGETWVGAPAYPAKAHHRRNVALGFVTENITALKRLLEERSQPDES